MKSLYRTFRYVLCDRKFRGLTSPLRVLPDFIVIGVGRGGTTTLHHNLSKTWNYSKLKGLENLNGTQEKKI